MRLQGKIALVTGGGRGIGAAIARGFAAEGARVAVLARTEAELLARARRIQEETGAEVLPIVGDVSREDDAIAAIAKVVQHFGGIDILVNCAGVSIAADSHQLTDDDWDRCLRINLYGTFYFCKHAGARMIQQGRGGSIINITSITAHAAIPRRAAYAASKGGVMQLTQNLAVEWARHGIRVNNITPGFIWTEIFDQYVKRGVHQPEKLEARIPLGRLGKPEDLVGPALFLASEDSRYVTGTTLVVDGGWLANGYI
ncbi:MAG: SDR family oxidoreductase [Chloroflexi bacterium]|uniref:Short-chain dehydrogenase n=1 Tax=Alicyclobacillus cellulosilyticus TaxID=1003997 RepID=A0A917K588_9BACL|nr:glucose 1-dehydrogenase [Alicyclobacillus cellulosilyticus]MBX6773546.1 SDR family oxidoreductase [Chloroflexota bacterium]GGI98396.1 short-chain dehydrogenase [Alicyclobacillus cellulosilyticus]